MIANISKKTPQNRLFGLPIELIEKIFEYDDTCKQYYEKHVLCKKEEEEEDEGEDEYEYEPVTVNTLDKNRHHFYQMILQKRRFKEGEHRKKFCQLISCGIKTSWFDDDRCIEYPFPYDLTYIQSRHIPRVHVQKHVYRFNGQTYYFICCPMEIRTFVKEMYRFLGEPDGDELEDTRPFEVFLYTDWEDDVQEHSFIPLNNGTYSYMDKKVSYGQYKKMVLSGESVGDYHNLILFADKNQQGEDVVFIQVDIDVSAVAGSMGFIHLIMGVGLKKRLHDIYEKQVYDIIQVNKEYLVNATIQPTPTVEEEDHRKIGLQNTPCNQLNHRV